MKMEDGTDFHLHSQVNEVYFIHLPMKMEPTVSSETSAIRTQTPVNYPKRNKLQKEYRLLTPYLFFYLCACIEWLAVIY